MATAPPTNGGGGASIPPPVDSAWVFELPLPQGNLLSGVFVGDTDAYAVGEQGAVVHLTSTGATREAAGATPATLRAITSTGQTLWAVGDSGAVLRGQAGQWKAQAAGTAALYTVWTRGETAFAAGLGNLIWSNTGAGWKSQALPGQGASDVVRAAAVQGADLYLVGSAGRILHFWNNNWFIEGDGLTPLDLNSVALDGAGAVYAAGKGGRILRRDPQAGRWSVDHPRAGGPALTRADLRAVWSAGGAVFAVAIDGTVLRRGAMDWQVEATGVSRGRALAGGGGKAGSYIVGEFGAIQHRAAGDPGMWQAAPGSALVTTAALTAAAADGSSVYAATEDGAILRRAAGAPSWTADFAPMPAPGQPLLSIAVRGDEAYAVGMGGVILHRTPQGWQSETYPWTDRRPDWKGVWIKPGPEVFVVGSAVTQASDEEAVILRKAAGAWTVEKISPKLLTALYAVAGNGTEVLAMGTLGKILHRGGDGTWTLEDLDVALDAQLFGLVPSGSDFYAVGTRGTVLQRTTAMGKGSWTRTAVPGADGTLNAIVAVGPDLWAVGQGGLAARRSGQAWLLDPTLSTSDLSGLAVVGTDLIAVGSGGVILRRPSK